MLEFIVDSYPRSGNTFLATYIKESLPKEHLIYSNLHSSTIIDDLSKNTPFIMPIRNPIDCISSWHIYREKIINELPEDLKKSVKFYIRYFNKALEYKKYLLFADFDIFTKNLKYIDYIVFERYTIDINGKIDNEHLKTIMIDKNLNDYLPSNNNLIDIKNELVTVPMFKECLDIYEQLKKEMNDNSNNWFTWERKNRIS